jgi:hypothetical protein
MLRWQLAVCALAGCGRIGFGDVNTGDGGSIGDARPCTALLCDDFETGDLSKWSSPTVSMNATAVVNTKRPRGGLFGLEATIPASSSGGGIAAACLAYAPQASGVLAVREWINTPVPLVNFDLVAGVIDQPACQATSPLRYATVGCDFSGMWVSTEFSPVGGQVDHVTTTPCAPIGQWTCIELDYVFGGPPPRIRVFVNDATVIDAAASDPTPSFSAATVGVQRAEAAGYQVFVDDVVIDTKHIGCH